MSDRAPIPLTPISIEITSPEFTAISGWPYAASFVTRLLRNDIPQREQFGNLRVWIYRDPEGRLVGFGTMDICDDYRDLTEELAHPYIPLLAVNPTIKSLGYGTSIVQHLIDEATLLASSTVCHDVLFLDVYTDNEKAIAVYAACGFTQVTDLIPDPKEGGKTYIVMAKRVTISSTTRRR